MAGHHTGFVPKVGITAIHLLRLSFVVECAHHFIVGFTFSLCGILTFQVIGVHHGQCVTHIAHAEIPSAEISCHTTETTPKADIDTLLTVFLLFEVFYKFLCLTDGDIQGSVFLVALLHPDIHLSADERTTKPREFRFVELRCFIQYFAYPLASFLLQLCKFQPCTAQLSAYRHISRLSVSETLRVGKSLAGVSVAERGNVGFLQFSALRVELHFPLCGLSAAQRCVFLIFPKVVQSFTGILHHLLRAAFHLSDICAEAYFVLFRQRRFPCRRSCRSFGCRVRGRLFGLLLFRHESLVVCRLYTIFLPFTLHDCRSIGKVFHKTVNVFITHIVFLSVVFKYWHSYLFLPGV